MNGSLRVVAGTAAAIFTCVALMMDRSSISLLFSPSASSQLLKKDILPPVPTLTPASLVEACNQVLSLSRNTFPLSAHVEYEESALNCIQLVRAVQSWTEPPISLLGSPHVSGNGTYAEDPSTYAQPLVVARRRLNHYTPKESVLRLAKRFQQAMADNGTQQELKILALGGSFTAGVDSPYGKVQSWPQKLQLLLNTTFNSTQATTLPKIAFRVHNMGKGGANQKFWLGKIRKIAAHNADIILVESAINDQSDYDQTEQQSQKVHQASTNLLSQLIHLPNAPAVLQVEVFRTANNNLRDAKKHCKGHVHKLPNPLTGKDYYYCPQWWLPQEWRQPALTQLHVPFVSYRDAIWPNLTQPPQKLPYYWTGDSHPHSDSHHWVATTVLMGFQTLYNHLDFFLTAQPSQTTFNATTAPDEELCGMTVVFEHRPKLVANSSLLQQVEAVNQKAHAWKGTHWMFGTDSKPMERLDRYGWIYEQDRSTNQTDLISSSVFSLPVKIGGDGKIVVTRLVSHDSRMATAKVWFSHAGKDALTDTAAANATQNNVFAGAPLWNIPSQHKEFSIPESYTLKLPKTFADNPADLSWPEKGKSLSLTMNMAVIQGSSKHATIDKFKLLSVESC